jgi:hypothetical protein
MILNNYQTIGIASDENKLKLAAIFFDKVYNIDKEIKVPDSIMLRTKIDTKKFDGISENLKTKFDTDYKKNIQ